MITILILSGGDIVENFYKEVFFDAYCGTCKYCDLDEFLSPCNECLENPVNNETHKPVNWEKGVRQKDEQVRTRKTKRV